MYNFNSKKIALYARRSSELQNDKSVHDQFAVMEIHLSNFQPYSVKKYFDDGISGRNYTNRPGILQLINDIGLGLIECVFVESTDRLSRDPTDLNYIFKVLTSMNVDLITLSDGQVSYIKIAFDSIKNHEYLKDLGMRTKRGHIGGVKQGRVVGGLTFGYRINTQIRNANGDRIKGHRIIDENQAKVIKRIYYEYGILKRPIMQIIDDLNRDNIPSPRGKTWHKSSLNSNHKRMRGLLCNPMYIGQIVYGRSTIRYDPLQNKKKVEFPPAESFTINSNENLRIIDQDIWDAVQDRISQGHKYEKTNYKNVLINPFKGKVYCTICGGTIVKTNDRFVCNTRLNRGKSLCQNGVVIKTNDILLAIIKKLQEFKFVDIEKYIKKYKSLNYEIIDDIRIRVRQKRKFLQKLIQAGQINNDAVHQTRKEITTLENEILDISNFTMSYTEYENIIQNLINVLDNYWHSGDTDDKNKQLIHNIIDKIECNHNQVIVYMNIKQIILLKLENSQIVSQ